MKKHASQRWMVPYIKRWLNAPVEQEDGQLVPRQKGTPQGGVISPLLANLFLHYAFDRWMAANFPQIPFELPALKRLEEAKLLKSTLGPRKRLRYAMTKEGEKALKENLEAGPAHYWQQGQTDIFGTLPRGIILAWLQSGAGEAHAGVEGAAYNLSVLSQRRQRDGEELRASMSHQQAGIVNRDPANAKGLLIATAYQWIKAKADATVFRLQAEAIKEMHDLIAALPSAPELR